MREQKRHAPRMQKKPLRDDWPVWFSSNRWQRGNTPNLSTPVSRTQHRMRQVSLGSDWLVYIFYPIAGKGGPIAACQRVSSCPFRRLPLVVIGSSDCLCLIGQNNCLLHPKKNQHTLIMIMKFYSWISINDFTPNILGKQLQVLKCFFGSRHRQQVALRSFR